MAIMGSGTTRANFGDLLEPGFREIFFQQYAEIPTTYDKLFHVMGSGKHQEYDSSVTGFGQLVETTEGQPVTYEDPLQGLTKNKHYGVIRGLEKLRKLLEHLKIIITTKVKTLWNKTISRQKPCLI